jgi:phosphate transport system permease protein
MFLQMAWVVAPLVSQGDTIVPVAGEDTLSVDAGDTSLAPRGALSISWGAGQIGTEGQGAVDTADIVVGTWNTIGPRLLQDAPSTVLEHTQSESERVIWNTVQRWALVSDQDGLYRLYDIAKNVSFEGSVLEDTDQLVRIAIAPLGRTMLLQSKNSLGHYQVVRQKTAPYDLLLQKLGELAFTGPVLRIGVSPSGGHVAVQQQNQLVLWQLFGHISKTIATPQHFTRWLDDRHIVTESAGQRFVLSVFDAEFWVTPGLLFRPQHSVGYNEPLHIWTGEAATDTTTPKLSLAPLIFGSIKAASVSMLFCMPLAIGAAIYVGFFMSLRARNRIKPLIEILESVPPVVIGALFAVTLGPRLTSHFLPVMGALAMMFLGLIFAGIFWDRKIVRYYRRDYFSPLPFLLLPYIALCMALGAYFARWLELTLIDGTPFLAWIAYTQDWQVREHNSIIVGLALGLAMMPALFSLVEDAVRSVPKSIANASIALGATRWQSLTKVVFPIALPSVISALMLVYGRAMGETMIVLMLSGNTPILDLDLTQGLRTIAATLAIELPEAAVDGVHYRVLFLAALLLFLITLVFNSAAEWLRHKTRVAQQQLD